MIVVREEVVLVYRIGMFSKIAKTTVKTLRYYDEVKLLSPEYIDEENGYRYYTTKQLILLHKIVGLRQMGFSIGEVHVVLNSSQATNVLLQRKIELTTHAKELEDQISRINHYILDMEENSMPHYNATIKDIPECIVYSKRFIAPTCESYFEIIPTIGAEVLATNPNLKCAMPEYCFIEYHDTKYQDKDIDIEYFEAVNEFGKDTDTIKFKKIPAVTVVSVMHKGSYQKLADAYYYLFNWIENNGYMPTGNCRESYIDGIWNKADENDWLTELQTPIIKINALSNPR